MRQVSLFILCTAAVLGNAVLDTALFGSKAHAADLDDYVLRGSQVPVDEDGEPPPRYVPGSPVYYRWQGIYAGGVLGRTSAGVDFGQGTASLTDDILRNDVVGSHVSGWTTLPKKDTSGTSYGGFVGYNYQADDLVLSAELGYNRFGSSGLHPRTSESTTLSFNDDSQAPALHHFSYTASVSNSAAVTLKDFATVRGRAGVVFDRFMPYAFGGVALGRVDYVRSATVAYTRTDNPDVGTPALPILNFGPQTQSEQRDGVIAYGYTAGLGLDVALTENFFMRGEWEYVQFFPVEGFKIHLNTLRVGAGVKF